jgi:hypothetical protein
VAPAGDASVRFAIRGPSGATALDTARPLDGAPADYLRQALEDVLAGPTRHGGALLAPFAIRYVVAAPNDLPSRARHRLERQLDLDSVPTEGLLVFQNEKLVPTAGVLADPAWASAAEARSVDVVASLGDPGATALVAGPGGASFGGTVPDRSALVYLSEAFDDRWGSGGGSSPGRPEVAFGWATAFRPAAAGSVEVRFGGQRTRTVQLGILAALWLAAAWITRKPVRRG